MKTKSIFLIALASLSLASCADDEPVSVRTNSDPISFRSGMASRATETTNSNLSSIYVSAFADGKPYFENEAFVKGSDSYFTSSKHYSWLENTDTISFYAYSPSQDDLGADINIASGKTAPELTGFSVAPEIADQVDFITANAKGDRKEDETSGVELTFDHRLSQIEIMAKSENSTYTIKVKGARIGRVEYMGDFDFATKEWTLDDWHDTSIYDTSIDEITLGAEPQSLMGTAGNAMLMPQTLTPWSPKDDPDNVARESYLSVLVQVTRTDNGYQIYPFPSEEKYTHKAVREYGWASIPLSGTWEQGKKYIYTLDFTYGAGNVDPDDPQPGEPVIPGEIKFKVTVNDWVDSDSSIPMTPVTK